MSMRKLAGAWFVLCLLTRTATAVAADDATMFRVFLKDGRSLVSYGELARVGDRVVFSMPTGCRQQSALRLVDIAADRVDWDRTDRYADSARSGRYLESQAEIDYTALSNQIAQTLNDVGETTDTSRRLALVEQARKTLADWPRGALQLQRSRRPADADAARRGDCRSPPHGRRDRAVRPEPGRRRRRRRR